MLLGIARFEFQGMPFVVPEGRAAEDIAVEHAGLGEQDLCPQQRPIGVAKKEALAGSVR